MCLVQFPPELSKVSENHSFPKEVPFAFHCVFDSTLIIWHRCFFSNKYLRDFLSCSASVRRFCYQYFHFGFLWGWTFYEYRFLLIMWTLIFQCTLEIIRAIAVVIISHIQWYYICFANHTGEIKWTWQLFSS